jgi:putative transposase
VTVAACGELAPVVGTTRACMLSGRSRATWYRAAAGPVHGPRAPRTTRPKNALGDEERTAVLAVLRSPIYRDLAVAQVWAMLLDDGTYLASQSTMHRILRAAGEHRDRRRQRTHPAKKKPQLVARKSLETWSWDITKLPGAVRGVFFDCYVIIDIFSRYVVGWTVAAAEDADIAAALIDGACRRQGIEKGQLTLHADRGTSMTSKTVAQLLEDLGVPARIRVRTYAYLPAIRIHGGSGGARLLPIDGGIMLDLLDGKHYRCNGGRSGSAAAR